MIDLAQIAENIAETRPVARLFVRALARLHRNGTRNAAPLRPPIAKKGVKYVTSRLEERMLILDEYQTLDAAQHSAEASRAARAPVSKP